MNRRRVVAMALMASVVGIAKAKDVKKDPDEIGNRDVSKGVNLYSLEKEIALGKQLLRFFYFFRDCHTHLVNQVQDLIFIDDHIMCKRNSAAVV